MRGIRIWQVLGLVALAVPLLLAAAGVAHAQATRAVTVEMVEWALRPNTLTVPVGTTVNFVAVAPASAQFPHAIQVRGQGLDTRSENARPGEQTTLQVTFSRPGTYEFFCPVGNGSHRERGMDGTITVVAAGGAPAVTGLPRTGGAPGGLPVSPAVFAALGGVVALGAAIVSRRWRR